MKTTITKRRNGVCFSRFYNSKFFPLAVGAVFSCLPARAQTNLSWDGLPDPNAPWLGSLKKGSLPTKATEKTVTTTTSPVTPSATSVAVSSSTLKAPKATKHQVSFSGDYFLGQGDVTLPLGFSLAASGFAPSGYNPAVVKPERNADYVGGTLSYTYGQSWYLDIGYSQGDSNGEVDANLGGGFTAPSQFTIKDTAYQAYVRYVPTSLRGKRLSAYFRAGVSFVDSEITDTLADPLLGFYREDIKATDLLGNVGFGVGYRLFSMGRFRLGLQGELEAFYGVRTQDITESFPAVPITLPSVTIDNTLYGGIGRGTMRMEYRLGQSGLFRIFVDAGVQLKYTQIEYPDAVGFQKESFDEILWGPYAKLGFSYSF